jgi:hypothetical protein
MRQLLSCKHLQPIDRALDTPPSPIQDVGVDHGRLDAPVA